MDPDLRPAVIVAIVAAAFILAALLHALFGGDSAKPQYTVVCRNDGTLAVSGDWDEHDEPEFYIGLSQALDSIEPYCVAR